MTYEYFVQQRSRLEAGEAFTGTELTQLQPYAVKSALILAAGIGSRLVPLTYERPKGLLEVNGSTLIERQIQQLKQAHINDINIVIGYKKDLFRQQLEKYGVNFIENPDYIGTNTISSMYYARDVLQNSYILYADNYLNANPFHAYEYRPWYSTSYLEGENKEWEAIWDDDERVIGFNDCVPDSWSILGPSYMDAQVGEKMGRYIAQYYRQGKTDYYWEDIWREHMDEFGIYVELQDKHTVVEFDTLDELRAFDGSYNESSGSGILRDIASYLNVEERAITNCRPRDGRTDAFVLTVNNRDYVYYMDTPDKQADRLPSGYIAAC